VAAITPKISAMRKPRFGDSGAVIAGEASVAAVAVCSRVRSDVPPYSIRLPPPAHGADLRLRFLAAALAVVVAGVLGGCVDGSLAGPSLHVLDEPADTGTWAAVTVGKDHTCALDVNGRAYCWGSNEDGQLGVRQTGATCGSADEKYSCSPNPVLVFSAVRFLTLTAGAAHNCGIAVDQGTYCWGRNRDGQLGDIGISGPAVSRVSLNSSLGSLASGFNHSCGVRADGALFCWGGNDHGQIGNGSNVTAFFPVRITNVLYSSVSVGQRRTCARTRTGVLNCWGDIWLRRDGGFEYARTQLTPETVPSAPSLSGIAVGAFATCGFDATGFGYCWEANPNGQMGTGTTLGSPSPRRMASHLEFFQMSAGLLQTCGIAVGGLGFCWGDNTFGQLGIPSGSNSERCGVQALPCTTRPLAIFGRHAWSSISTGLGSHTCGVTIRRHIYCWGLGNSGQRGDGSVRTVERVPILVAGPR
jgi:alpha-tubulin suppressor-like RCC1 family protein